MLKVWGRSNSVNVKKALWAIERPAQPGLEAWFERLCVRPAFRKIVDIQIS